MIADVRAAYNEAFTRQRFGQLMYDLNGAFDEPIAFRVAETPVFLPDDFLEKVRTATSGIVDVICQPNFRERTEGAIPARWRVPGEPDHPHFLVIDFAVGRDEAGAWHPWLIELQGFPSLFGYQEWLAAAYRRHFPVPENFTHRFGGHSPDTYRDVLRRTILGDHPAESVVLLEIEPFRQKTAIDFYCTRELLGIEPVCLTEIAVEGRQLFYRKGERRVPIRRLYNRIIFDELEHRQDVFSALDFNQEYDVEWAGHPHWFFRVSKYTLPLLSSPYVPETHRLSDLDTPPTDLENWVLKPLFSFAGAGVKFDVVPKDLRVDQPENFILQRKIEYVPAVESPEGKIKTEVRIMLAWPDGADRPEMITNLCRLSQGKMIGVDYNKDKTWVGGSVGFFDEATAR